MANDSELDAIHCLRHVYLRRYIHTSVDTLRTGGSYRGPDPNRRRYREPKTYGLHPLPPKSRGVRLLCFEACRILSSSVALVHSKGNDKPTVHTPTLLIYSTDTPHTTASDPLDITPICLRRPCATWTERLLGRKGTHRIKIYMAPGTGSRT
jgi:hypothetical protein